MKVEQYERLTKQAIALIESEKDLIANLGNISALLNMELEHVNWVGFYLLQDEELVLGPFQGKPCTGQVQQDTFFREFSNSIGDRPWFAECSLSRL